MAPDDPGKRGSLLGVAAYLLVPGERRRRAAGHFGRAAIEAARGVRALSVPSRSNVDRPADGEPADEKGDSGGRQRIRID